MFRRLPPAPRLPLALLFALGGLVAAAPPVSAQPRGIQATVTYSGELGPIDGNRPLCLCIYADAALDDLLGCRISFTNGTTFQVTTFDTRDYFLIAFVDLVINERLDAGEPFEIYDDRYQPPADAVTAQAGFADVDIAFADQGLSPPPTPSPLPCAGDCDESGELDLADSIALVRIALGAEDLAACSGADGDDSGAVEVDEIVALVGHSPSPCP